MKIHLKLPEGGILVFLTGKAEILKLQRKLEEALSEKKMKGDDSVMKHKIFTLYSMLPTEKQKEVFDPVPEGTRQIIIATNVAETSITIPGVKYVVDSGREKKKTFDERMNMSQFVISWISQASSE